MSSSAGTFDDRRSKSIRATICMHIPRQELHSGSSDIAARSIPHPVLIRSAICTEEKRKNISIMVLGICLGYSRVIQTVPQGVYYQEIGQA